MDEVDRLSINGSIRNRFYGPPSVPVPLIRKMSMNDVRTKIKICGCCDNLFAWNYEINRSNGNDDYREKNKKPFLHIHLLTSTKRDWFFLISIHFVDG
jgi:hypothetical protein